MRESFSTGIQVSEDRTIELSFGLLKDGEKRGVVDKLTLDLYGNGGICVEYMLSPSDCFELAGLLNTGASEFITRTFPESKT